MRPVNRQAVHAGGSQGSSASFGGVTLHAESIPTKSMQQADQSDSARFLECVSIKTGADNNASRTTCTPDGAVPCPGDGEKLALLQKAIHDILQHRIIGVSLARLFPDLARSIQISRHPQHFAKMGADLTVVFTDLIGLA